MAKVTPSYPASTWNGSTTNRTRRDDNIEPNSEDWDRLAAEVISMQENITGIPNTPAAALTAAVGGTANSGDVTTDIIIENLRTRQGEIEAALIAAGILSAP